MGKPIFEVEISNGSPKGYETATVMEMPATWAEFNDALQKARIKDGRSCKNELTCIRCEALRRGMIGDHVNLYDLNLFAQRLATLTEDQRPGMEALLKMEQEQYSGPIPLERLINLTYNTDVCCFAPRVTNHEELGTFLYENEMLSDEAMALLGTTDEGSGFRERLLELLGEQHQEDHGGVFTDRGYHATEGYYQNIGEDGFTEADHIRLRDALIRIEGKFLLSYNDDAFVRGLYDQPGICLMETTRINNIKQRYDNGAQFPELLIANYDLRERSRMVPSQMTLFDWNGGETIG